MAIHWLKPSCIGRQFNCLKRSVNMYSSYSVILKCTSWHKLLSVFHWQVLITCMLYHEYVISRVSGASSQQRLLNHIFIYLLGIFCCFSSKNSILTFHFFFDELLNFRNRILTNQKLEQVIRNCQWNYSILFSNLQTLKVRNKLLLSQVGRK